MARRTFYATRADGTVVKRTSENRVYTHCVVVDCAVDPDPASTWRPEGGSYTLNAEWAGRRDLAEKNAARYNAKAKQGRCVYRAEVLEARETP